MAEMNTSPNNKLVDLMVETSTGLICQQCIKTQIDLVPTR